MATRSNVEPGYVRDTGTGLDEQNFLPPAKRMREDSNEYHRSGLDDSQGLLGDEAMGMAGNDDELHDRSVKNQSSLNIDSTLWESPVSMQSDMLGVSPSPNPVELPNLQTRLSPTPSLMSQVGSSRRPVGRPPKRPKTSLEQPLHPSRYKSSSASDVCDLLQSQLPSC